MDYQLSGQQYGKEKVAAEVADGSYKAGSVDEVWIEPQGHKPHTAAQHLLMLRCLVTVTVALKVSNAGKQ